MAAGKCKCKCKVAYHTDERHGYRCDIMWGTCMFLIFFNVCIKYILICVLWMTLEQIIYGEVQPRIVDDIIGIILLWYIYQAEKGR